LQIGNFTPSDITLLNFRAILVIIVLAFQNAGALPLVFEILIFATDERGPVPASRG